MELSHRRRISSNEFAANFLSKAINTTQLDKKKLCQIMNMTEGNLEDIFNQKMDLSYRQFYLFLDYFNISFNNLVNDEIDWQLVIDYHLQNSLKLPKRYAEHAFSKRRTVINILSFIERYFGVYEKKSILKNFQLRESQFEDPNAEINTLFCQDLLDYLFNQRRFSKDLSFAMGIHSFTTNSNCEELHKKLSSHKSTKEMYERTVLEDAHRWDENHQYKIEHLSHQKCIVSVKQNERVQDLLRVKKFGNIHVEKMVAGVFASFPLYLSKPAARFNHLSSIHWGYSIDKYEFLWQ